MLERCLGFSLPPFRQSSTHQLDLFISDLILYFGSCSRFYSAKSCEPDFRLVVSVGHELPSVKLNPHSYLWFPTGEYFFSHL